ncbi:MAG: tetratricopeptide repeat protein, partial [Spirochaetaceae bacterium]|nr:tetratricopeptide repeat protein [Spirochaetaceae bacterium]
MGFLHMSPGSVPVKGPAPMIAAGMILLAGLLVSCQAAPGEEGLLRYARASAVYSEGRFSEAAGMLKDLRSFPPALVLRGKAEYFSGDDGSAEKSFRRALALRPAAAEASIYLARLLRDRGREGEAETLVESVIADDPSDLRALRLAADISRAKGPAGEAAA